MTSLTTEAENTKLIRRMKDELNDHTVGAFENYEAGMVRSGDETPLSGRGDVRALFEEYLAAFPDYHDETPELVAEGDRVVTYNEVTGTHDGPFRGIEPTGTSVRYNSFGLYWIEDAQIVGSTGMLGWPTLLILLAITT
jgi:predicted ester cyclase